jgi:hypothetical protein
VVDFGFRILALQEVLTNNAARFLVEKLHLMALQEARVANGFIELIAYS